MMLFPYSSEPATGSRIPSMSTGGAAMNATMKQMVAVNRVGIISTPNQPTYKRLLVEVTHSQKLSQVDVCCLERVESYCFEQKSKTIRKWWSYYFFLTLRGRYERLFFRHGCLVLVRRVSTKKEWRTQRVVTFLNVVDLFIIPGPCEGPVKNNIDILGEYLEPC